MSIVITGATGQLGRHVVEALLERNVPAETIIAAGRSIEKLADFADQGVQVRAMDYEDASSVAEALKGANKVLLISGSAVGQRVEQHRTVIEAAKAEGVELLAYTSIANAETTGMKLAAEHKATEAILKESGVPFVLLRNGWYLENYTEHLPGTLAQGRLRVAQEMARSVVQPAPTMLMRLQLSWSLTTRQERCTSSVETTLSPWRSSLLKSPPLPAKPSLTTTCPRLSTRGC